MSVVGLLLFVAAGNVFAQSDIIRMMQYNLMYYTNSSGVSECNSATNNLNNKDMNIKTIFKYVQPDVFCVCEMGSSNDYADRLLNNVINTDGVNYFKRGPLTSYSGGTIANMIYYDSRKLTLRNSYTVSTAYRDINGYRFFYNSNNLASGDTIFMTFWIAHLKAGSYSSDRSARLTQVQRLMNKITQLGDPGNIFFSGDFNFYSSDEPAYQELTNYSNSLYRFYDPINRPGDWHSNYQFASLHTQSTHSSDADCFSAGGLDDRFDFFLVSPYIYYGSNKVHLVPGSYYALGQDGNHYNSSIISPANNSVPTNVANALYNQSDHLPVIMEVSVDAHVGVRDYQPDFFVNVTNPVRDELQIELQNEEPDLYNISIYAMDGRCIANYSEQLESGIHYLNYPFPSAKGIYIVLLHNQNGQQITKKVVRY